MRYAISDIHGCPKTLRLALQEVNFSHEDELFLLGDYIDRGPDSQGVINFIWELEAKGHRVVCLRGNHEQMLLDHHFKNHTLHKWAPEPRVRERTMEWMNKLEYYHETPGYILVHAGLNFRYRNPLDDKEEMLWIRYWYDDMKINPGFLGDRVVIHGHTPAKMLEINRGIKYMDSIQAACIDSGCSQQMEGMGYLTVLNLDTKKAVFVRKVD